MLKKHHIFIVKDLSLFPAYSKMKENNPYEIIETEDDGITKFRDALNGEIFDIRTDDYDAYWCFFLESDFEERTVELTDLKLITSEQSRETYGKILDFELNKDEILTAIRSNDKEQIQKALLIVEHAKSELNLITNGLVEQHRGY